MLIIKTAVICGRWMVTTRQIEIPVGIVWASKDSDLRVKAASCFLKK